MGSKMTKLLVVFSDTHCGSREGLMLAEHHLVEEPEVIIKATPVQLWLLDAWEQLWKNVYSYIGKDAWVAAHIGDAVEGLHHKRKGLISDEKSDHFKIFMDTVYPKIMPASKRIFVLGTEAHGGRTDEMMLAKQCRAVKHPDTNRYAENRWLIDLNGYPIILRHHINCTSREYLRANALSANLANEQLAALRRGRIVPRGMVAAHRHMHDYIDNGNDFCLICGPWQATTRYGHTNWSPMTPEPTISVIDARNKKKGEKPVVVTFKATPEGESCVKL